MNVQNAFYLPYRKHINSFVQRASNQKYLLDYFLPRHPLVTPRPCQSVPAANLLVCKTMQVALASLGIGRNIVETDVITNRRPSIVSSLLNALLCIAVRCLRAVCAIHWSTADNLCSRATRQGLGCLPP